MNTKSRISSILKTNHLDETTTGIPAFDLGQLQLKKAIDFELPTNLRLGHLAEKVVAELIKSSSNYEVLFENIQLIDEKQTIGELDFIIQEKESQQVTHMELAYKFYLFDPTISTEPIKNWIGPNRNDSLIQKLEKSKQKQFPLLNHPIAKTTLHPIDIDKVAQALCLLVSLFVPFDFKTKLNSKLESAIKGHYFTFETFTRLNNTSKTYYLPSKKEWGMDPSENKNWSTFEDLEKTIQINMAEKQAPLCWQKDGDKYSAFFIVWWTREG